MSFNPNSKKRAVDHACFLAIRAIQREAASDPRLALAAALEAIDRERTARRSDSLFTLQDCIAHLRDSAAPQRRG